MSVKFDPTEQNILLLTMYRLNVFLTLVFISLWKLKFLIEDLAYMLKFNLE